VRPAGLVVATVLLVASCALEPTSGDRVTDGPGSGGFEGRIEVTVVHVTDGDTIRVDLLGRETPVRLIGIDTPEEDGPHTDQECFGEEASRFTTIALGGRTIELEFDVERTDRFDRTLAYVWLDGALFNERLVRSGHAVVTTFPPNVRYVERFTAAQRGARDERRGLWGACGPV
jgi:micrococcal nuclease